MTQTVPDISPLMPMHQDPLLVYYVIANRWPSHVPMFLGCRAQFILKRHWLFHNPCRRRAWRQVFSEMVMQPPVCQHCETVLDHLHESYRPRQDCYRLFIQRQLENDILRRWRIKFKTINNIDLFFLKKIRFFYNNLKEEHDKCHGG